MLLLVTLGPGAVPGSGPAHGRGGGVETEVFVGYQGSPVLKSFPSVDPDSVLEGVVLG